MKLGIAQLNLTVGDIAGNAAKLLAAANEAHAAGAVLLLTPEMSVCGYPAEDLVLRADFTAACRAAVEAAVDAPPGWRDRGYRSAATACSTPRRCAGGVENITASTTCRIIPCSTNSAYSTAATHPACSPAAE
jgi:NAD+ synthase (glutamine-hydrolysing)